MASDMETNPYELNKMINISFKNPKKLFQQIDGLIKKALKVMELSNF